jgi:hypothetical protein
MRVPPQAATATRRSERAQGSAKSTGTADMMAIGQR